VIKKLVLSVFGFGLGLLSTSGIVVCQDATESSEKWIQLFKGKDLDGWTPKIRYYDFGDNYAETFRVQDAKELAAGRPSLLLDRGYISLQSESHPIDFRKVELLELK